jgi:hypothetical protein
MHEFLPKRHSDTDELDLSNPDKLRRYNAAQANNNVIAWLRMAYPLAKHQHEIKGPCTAESEYPQGVAQRQPGISKELYQQKK